MTDALDLMPRLQKAVKRCHPHLRACLARSIDHGTEPHLAAWAMIYFGCDQLGLRVDRGELQGPIGARLLREFAAATSAVILTMADEMDPPHNETGNPEGKQK